MFTRKDYLGKVCTHEQYYSQFVTAHSKALVLGMFDNQTLVKSYQKDDYFNDKLTPLKKWDFLAKFLSTPKIFTEAGGWQTLSERICILKQSAREIVLELLAGVEA
jgi:hypothetical protein